MKRTLLLLSVFLLFACNNNRESKSAPFKPGMLLPQLFSINPGKDTAITTVHGSVIRILSGSFNVSGTVSLEIREALTPSEILAAGLSTESNGRLLRSAGMIYINATVDGQKTELLKSINVSIRNKYYDSSMQIFKGVETDSGTINWTDPVSPEPTVQADKWLKSKTLFQQKCAPCHSIFKDGTGPALAGIDERIPDRKTIHRYVNNPVMMTNSGSYFYCLKERFGSMMTPFPDLSTDDIDGIIDYINNEATVNPQLEETIRVVSDFGRFDRVIKPCQCGEDTFYVPVPKEELAYFENTPRPVTDTIFPPAETGPQKLDNPADRGDTFDDANPTTGMYDFEIKTFGWYNIDAFMEGYVGTTLVKVSAQVQIEFEANLHVYLFCPDKQILSVGYEKQGDQYLFNKINGKVPLFLGDRAIMFAFGSKADKMFYGISEFKIKGEQTVQVKVTETTSEEMRRALMARQLNGIDLGIEKKEMKIRNKPCGESGIPTDTTAMK